MASVACPLRPGGIIWGNRMLLTDGPWWCTGAWKIGRAHGCRRSLVLSSLPLTLVPPDILRIRTRRTVGVGPMGCDSAWTRPRSLSIYWAVWHQLLHTRPGTDSSLGYFALLRQSIGGVVAGFRWETVNWADSGLPSDYAEKAATAFCPRVRIFRQIFRMS